MKKCPVCDLAESLNTIIEAGYEDTDVSLDELDEAKKVFIKAFNFLVKKAVNEEIIYEDLLFSRTQKEKNDFKKV